YHDDVAGLRRLVEFSIEHYLPEAAGGGDPGVTFLRAGPARSARLCGAWMAAGFVHGVLNTDNINITGESFDYGPYRFLPHYEPAFTAAYFDHSGLYAYGRQPGTLPWNLQRLGECLRLVAEEAPLLAALQPFPPLFDTALVAAIFKRLNFALSQQEPDLDTVGAIF